MRYLICEARIARFQQAVAGIGRGRGGNIEWRHLAFDCGYYDQARFFRDFKLFSAFTPEKYLQKKNGVLNYVPVGQKLFISATSVNLTLSPAGHPPDPHPESLSRRGICCAPRLPRATPVPPLLPLPKRWG